MQRPDFSLGRKPRAVLKSDKGEISNLLNLQPGKIHQSNGEITGRCTCGG